MWVAPTCCSMILNCAYQIIHQNCATVLKLLLSQHQSPLLMSLLIFLCYTPLFCIDLKTSSMYTKEFMAECEQYMYLILVATQGSGKGVVVLEEAGDPGGKKGDWQTEMRENDKNCLQHFDNVLSASFSGCVIGALFCKQRILSQWTSNALQVQGHTETLVACGTFLWLSDFLSLLRL